MSEVLNNVYDYLILYGPTVVAVITTIISMVTAIKKCAEVSSESTTETKAVKKQMTDVIDKMNVVLQENVDLKKEIKKLSSSRVKK